MFVLRIHLQFFEKIIRSVHKCPDMNVIWLKIVTNHEFYVVNLTICQSFEPC